MKYKALSFLFSCLCVFASPCLLAEASMSNVNGAEEMVSGTEEMVSGTEEMLNGAEEMLSGTEEMLNGAEEMVSETVEEKRTGFFALDFSGSFIPSETFRFNGPGLGVLFGSQIIPQNIFSLGLRLDEGPAMAINYSYEFESNKRKWVPGISVSSLIGYKYSPNVQTVYLNKKSQISSYHTPSKPYLAFGLNVGVYLKVFITKNIATLFKTSLSHSLISVKEVNLEKDDIYWNIGAGVRWYLL